MANLLLHLQYWLEVVFAVFSYCQLVDLDLSICCFMNFKITFQHVTNMQCDQMM